MMLTQCFQTCVLPAVAAKPSKPPPIDYQLVPGDASKHERVLSFPQNYSLGTLAFGKVTRPARGKVVVPAGQLVRFIPAKSFYQNPGVINTLAEDSFDLIEPIAFSLDETDSSIGDRTLAYIGHLKGLLSVDVNRSDTTDAGLAHVAQLPNLQRLFAFQTAIEGKCLEQISTLKQLRSLNLGCNHLREDDLKYLASIPRLQHLHLVSCQIGDKGIKNLSHCTSLINLQIGKNRQITDQSIKYFLDMKNLRYLELCGTSITIAGAMQLKSLPLHILVLPGAPSKAERDKIARVFPGVGVNFPESKGGTVDSDTSKLFAPLH
jgi:hypothetical protein